MGCIPVPVNAVPTANGLAWRCVDGTVGTYGLRKYNLPCSAYTFSSTLNNVAPCSPYASAGISEGYNTFGWCVSCQITGNCPGAWAQVDLGFVSNVAGVYVSGRSGFCNFPLTLSVKRSMDGVLWNDVDGGNVFSTGLTLDSRCSVGQSSYMLQKPLSTVRFAVPVMARYIRVYPLTHNGSPALGSYVAYYAWWMCMQFEPLAVSEASSNLVVMYPFSSKSTLAQGFGSIPSVLSGAENASWTSALGGGLQLGVGQVVYSPFIDFSGFSEFTISYWTSVKSFSCSPKAISFGLLDSNGKVFYGVAPCYGTSYMKVTFDGTRSFNGFGWNQNPSGKNLQRFHGRRSGNGSANYFWFGEGRNAYASNGMSGAYEIFDLPYWPGKLRLSFGSPGHRHIIKMHDVRLYRDSSGSVPFDTSPTPHYVHTMDSCAICQPGFYCSNDQVYTCPLNTSSSYHASSITQCVCTLGLFKNPTFGCQLCKTGYYCPNQNTEVPCSVGCGSGFLYQSAACTASANRVCTPCPLTSGGVTPAACICPVNSYNNGSGAGCSVCPSNSISPINSFGLSACTCVSGYIASPTTDNATGTLLALKCILCPPGTYSLANTRTCFQFPSNTTVSDKSPLGFFCPNGYFMPMDVPVKINTTTGIPSRPGLIYWNFESNSFSVMRNEWGNYTPIGGSAYTQPRIFPDFTTADIQALNPNVTCKFGSRCALIGGTRTSEYKYTLAVPSFAMPAAGISVSFWFRINSCVSCTLGTPLLGVESWNFAGIRAVHAADTRLMLALIFSYNGLGTSHSQWSVYGTPPGTYPRTHDITMSSFKDVWHHHLFTFLPGGNFSGYLDGVLKVNKKFNKEFPSTV